MNPPNDFLEVGRKWPGVNFVKVKERFIRKVNDQNKAFCNACCMRAVDLALENRVVNARHIALSGMRQDNKGEAEVYASFNDAWLSKFVIEKPVLIRKMRGSGEKVFMETGAGRLQLIDQSPTYSIEFVCKCGQGKASIQRKEDTVGDITVLAKKLGVEVTE